MTMRGDISPASAQIDLSGHVVHANASFCQLLGLHKVVGRRFRDLLAPESRKRWDEIRQTLGQWDQLTESICFFHGKIAQIRFSWVGDGLACVHSEMLGAGRQVYSGSTRSTSSAEHDEGPVC